MKTIVLVGGGTAGHVIPNLALIPYLKDFRVVYLGNKNSMEEKLCRDNLVRFIAINSVKFSRTNMISNVKIPFLLPKYVNECKELLKKLNPSIVFSKGGFVSLPVTLACKKLGIPYLIHESDATLGLANKIVAKDAKLVLTNFEKTYTKNNAKCVGIPLRDSIFSNISTKNILNSLHLLDRKTILVVGGSLGAKAINDFIYDNIDDIVSNYNLIHLTGKGKAKNIIKTGYLPIEFTNDIGSLYKCADVVISRAGATAIAEIIALNKKAILIPLSKKASRGDQLKNATLVASNTIKVIPEDSLNKDSFFDTLTPLLALKANDQTQFNNPSKEIADIIYKLTK